MSRSERGDAMKWRHFLMIGEMLFDITDMELRPIKGDCVSCPTDIIDGELDYRLRHVEFVNHWMNDRYTTYELSRRDNDKIDWLAEVGWRWEGDVMQSRRKEQNHE